jgi:hypothetical protein
MDVIMYESFQRQKLSIRWCCWTTKLLVVIVETSSWCQTNTISKWLFNTDKEVLWIYSGCNDQSYTFLHKVYHRFHKNKMPVTFYHHGQPLWIMWWNANRTRMANRGSFQNAWLQVPGSHSKSRKLPTSKSPEMARSKQLLPTFSNKPNFHQKSVLLMSPM